MARLEVNRSGELEVFVRVIELGGFKLHPLVLMFAASGSLMVSRIRIPKL